MKEATGNIKDGVMALVLSGRIDSTNASQIEKEINEVLEGYSGDSLTINMEDLDYISSAGLRTILRLRKSYPGLSITDVNPRVYEILQTTGFTEMMNVRKAYRRVSVEGCEEIGRGANGTVYRIDGDNVVKVYNDADALDEIKHEREVAQLALVLGIPTAISYDVVRVDEGYGSVFELLNNKSFSKILADEPEKMDWCVKEYVKLLRKIHSTVVPDGKLPDMRQTALSWAQFVQEYLPEEEGVKLVRLVRNVPKSDYMIHGDYHTKNVQLTGDDVLLIDMDTLAVGNPVFELASMFNAFVGFGECDPEANERVMGVKRPVAMEFWKRVLAAYIGTNDEDKLREVENKARIIGYTRLIRRSIRRAGLEDPERKAEIDHWKGELIELIREVDSLTFLVNEISLDAVNESMPRVMEFIGEHLDESGCQMKSRMGIELAVEEMFINIAHYAYPSSVGSVTVHAEVTGDPKTAVITLKDEGIPYNPLEKEDPDVTLSAEERKIGGLGILLTKKTMDEIEYEYTDGSNILTMKKVL